MKKKIIDKFDPIMLDSEQFPWETNVEGFSRRSIIVEGIRFNQWKYPDGMMVSLVHNPLWDDPISVTNNEEETKEKITIWKSNSEQ